MSVTVTFDFTAFMPLDKLLDVADFRAAKEDVRLLRESVFELKGRCAAFEDEAKHKNETTQITVELLKTLLKNDCIEADDKAFAKSVLSLEKAEADNKRLREALEDLSIAAGDLMDHEIDGGAPDNRWDDLREERDSAEKTLQATP